ncbi:hypothetical protein VOLCADRAFT_105800 [Volvox carteri f. nagariensis]|uniref:Uncharacterized protein n=1 Tax=Volvox carteri f. nagariensis TaxID=3068 RepID=D8U373_VOLCA|nr:uncharacterized protein VOLCADRAFT_105800 [Volvox carteri f. nagariensis]EFJ45775.1 hypothetical protein VOLCADRAFT_105800 [Volvox carteri f. nagariensis]|eukprot:XP_002953176.1 hypothetical protein VOLCADRAFT_105800 [Volvox carteri f. nagariensis]
MVMPGRMYDMPLTWRLTLASAPRGSNGATAAHLLALLCSSRTPPDWPLSLTGRYVAGQEHTVFGYTNTSLGKNGTYPYAVGHVSIAYPTAMRKWHRLRNTDGVAVQQCTRSRRARPHEHLHSVHFDACFKLNLLSHKGYVSGYTQLGRPRYFLPNASIQQVLLDGHASQQIGVTHCSNFDADKWVRESIEFLGLSCHPTKCQWEPSQSVYHLGITINTAAGVFEVPKQKLAKLRRLAIGLRITAKKNRRLVQKPGTAVQYWWSDIACRWGKSYAKWLECQTPDLQGLGRGMRPLIPPWHRCAHRHVVRDLPARLWRMRTQAEAALDSARHRICVPGAALEQKGGDAAVVQQSLQQQPRQLKAADMVPASPAAEYARSSEAAAGGHPRCQL